MQVAFTTRNRSELGITDEFVLKLTSHKLFLLSVLDLRIG